MSWIKRIFSKDTSENAIPKVVKMEQLVYPPKIILATAKALEGNIELGRYLLENGYEELFYFVQAAHLKEEARKWLMNNGFPHLMALLNAAEGNESALTWLKVHQFDLFLHIAQAVEEEMDSFEWLKLNSTEDLFYFTLSLKKVKDNIEFNHNDMYSFGKDY